MHESRFWSITAPVFIPFPKWTFLLDALSHSEPSALFPATSSDGDHQQPRQRTFQNGGKRPEFSVGLQHEPDHAVARRVTGGTSCHCWTLEEEDDWKWPFSTFYRLFCSRFGHIENNLWKNLWRLIMSSCWSYFKSLFPFVLFCFLSFCDYRVPLCLPFRLMYLDYSQTMWAQSDWCELFSRLVITENWTLSGCRWRPVCKLQKQPVAFTPSTYYMSEDGHASSYNWQPDQTLGSNECQYNWKRRRTDRSIVLKLKQPYKKQNVQLVKIVLKRWSKHISG